MAEPARKRGRPRKDAARVLVLTPPAPKIPLNTLDDVRREAARVYREARAGALDSSDASKLSFMLQGIGKMIEATIVERRIAALESDGAMESLPYDVIECEAAAQSRCTKEG